MRWGASAQVGWDEKRWGTQAMEEKPPCLLCTMPRCLPTSLLPGVSKHCEEASF